MLVSTSTKLGVINFDVSSGMLGTQISDLESSLALVTLSGNNYSTFRGKGGDIFFFWQISIAGGAANPALLEKKELQSKRCKMLMPMAFCFIRKYNNDIILVKNAILSTEPQLLLQTQLFFLHSSTSSSRKQPLEIFFFFSFFIFLVCCSSCMAEKLRLATPLKPCCQGVAANYSCGDVRGCDWKNICIEFVKIPNLHSFGMMCTQHKQDGMQLLQLLNLA
ncbi:unnamed protein product [Coffea canephora]|uniref:Uncharacterized protein n=1 Tax=Coffea canephora TaxID=49390 RepID=A0A068UMI0_COFCA|nr:unnamed protein product [Coffea canephora]